MHTRYNRVQRVTRAAGNMVARIISMHAVLAEENLHGMAHIMWMHAARRIFGMVTNPCAQKKSEACTGVVHGQRGKREVRFERRWGFERGRSHIYSPCSRMPVIHPTKGDSTTHHAKVKGVLHLGGGKRDETPLAIALSKQAAWWGPKPAKPVLFMTLRRQGSTESVRYGSNARDRKLAEEEEAEEAEELQVWSKRQ